MTWKAGSEIGASIEWYQHDMSLYELATCVLGFRIAIRKEKCSATDAHLRWDYGMKGDCKLPCRHRRFLPRDFMPQMHERLGNIGRR